jgi:uncharacterized MAPEG superfamily protein
MPIELRYLTYAVILYFVMILAQSITSGLSGRTPKELLGARDDLPASGYSPAHARAKRAQANMTEGMMMFAPAVIVAYLTDNLSSTTALGAMLFFWGRAAFAPLYWFGVPMVRTIAWFVSIAGILMILWEILL